MSSVLRVTFKKNRFTFNPTANYDFFKVDQSFSKNEDNKEIESSKLVLLFCRWEATLQNQMI